MYRLPARRGTDESTPTELVYEFPDARLRRRTPYELAALMGGPIVLGGALALGTGPVVGLLVLVGTGALSAWAWTSRGSLGVVLQIADETLCVRARGDDRFEATRVLLSDLDEVELDETMLPDAPTRDGEDGGISSGPSRNGRIVLVAKSGARIPLTNEYRPHIEATEWFGRVRTFLRKNGWEPKDERQSVGS
jgi:hypothetical protein